MEYWVAKRSPQFYLELIYLKQVNEAPRSKLRGIKAELRRSQPAYAQLSFGVISHSSLQQATGYSGEGE